MVPENTGNFSGNIDKFIKRFNVITTHILISKTIIINNSVPMKTYISTRITEKILYVK